MTVILPAALFLSIILSSIAVIPESYAQEQTTIVTSADDHEKRFFGEAVLQIIVIDETSTDDDTIENMTINIDAHPDTGGTGSTTITVPETSESSGKFEFYLAHEAANVVSPTDLDSLNNQGVEGDGICAANCAPYVTFGPTGDVIVDSSLYEETRFDIASNDAEVTINYEQDMGTMQLDRESYGSNSFLYIFISDGDPNLNPTLTDEFTVDSDTDPNADLLVLDGATFDNQPIVFKETGDNTGLFKGKYQLGSSITVNSESIVLTLHEKANYDDDLGSPENDSNNTDEVSFSVGDDDGSVAINDNQQAPSTPTEKSPSDGNITTIDKVGQDTIFVKKPTAKDINGSEVEELQTGKQVILSTTVTNNNSGRSQPFTAILEVRDRNGVTVYLEWHIGILPPSSVSDIGLPWTPENPGDYVLRTFVVSDIANGEVLSPIAVSGGITVH